MITRKNLRALLTRREKERGYLIAFEGATGAGKTTQRKLFKDWLRSEGWPVVATKWNSSPLIAPLIEARKEAQSLSSEEYCLLHAADFRHRMETEILPALWKGKVVIADQYLFTALARDSARGLELSWLLNVHQPFVWPDAVFYFAVSEETSKARIARDRRPKFYESGQDVTRIADPLESYRQFTARLIREYEALAVIFEFMTLDAEKNVYEQHRAIRELFRQRRRRPWAQWNVEAIMDWIESRPAGEIQLV